MKNKKSNKGVFFGFLVASSLALAIGLVAREAKAAEAQQLCPECMGCPQNQN